VNLRTEGGGDGPSTIRVQGRIYDAE
jgi:hypothetical protein